MDAELASALVLAARLTLAVVLLTSGVSKLRTPASFVRQIIRYEIVPAYTTRPLAWSLLAGEIVAGLGLVVGWKLPLWLGLATVLLGSFAVAIAVTLRRGKRIPCGCFGDETELVQPRSLVRVGLLLGLVGGAALIRMTHPSLEVWVGGRDLLLVVSLVAFALMGGRLLLMFPDALTAMGYRRRQV